MGQKGGFWTIKVVSFRTNCFSQKLEMVMQETSSENCTVICQPLQSLQEFEVDNTKKYAQLILNFFWVVYKLLFVTSCLLCDICWPSTNWQYLFLNMYNILLHFIINVILAHCMLYVSKNLSRVLKRGHRDINHAGTPMFAVSSEFSDEMIIYNPQYFMS